MRFKRLGRLLVVLGLSLSIAAPAAASQAVFLYGPSGDVARPSSLSPLYLQQLAAFREQKTPTASEAAVLHRVARGETLSIIAGKYRISVEDLVRLNGLANPHFIREGQVLAVRRPPASEEKGTIHVLERGETIWSLSRRFGISMEAILAANAILRPEQLMAGQKIIIPEGASFTQVAPEPAREREIMVASRHLSRGAGDFSWPLEGTLTSGFGPRWGRFHYGIDIAAATGTPIRAVAAGVVTVAGWQSGYGYMVRIDHQNGWESLYAHASRLYVQAGRQVAAGEKIAAVGQTGNSTGPHLHLELIFQGEHKNPLKYLP